MKSRLVMLAVLILFSMYCFSAVSFAQDYYGHYEVEITEVPYKPVHAFFDLNMQAGSQMYGGGIGLTSARASDIQFETYLGYRSINNLEGTSNGAVSSFDIMLGGTYFPRKPSFELFDSPVRYKISLLGGFGLASESAIFTACISAALVFSSGDDPNGLTLGITYWPSMTIDNAQIPGQICASLGFMFAPSN